MTVRWIRRVIGVGPVIRRRSQRSPHLRMRLEFFHCTNSELAGPSMRRTLPLVQRVSYIRTTVIYH